jgi:hypothetical protein
MSQNRRDAVRITHGQPGVLQFAGRGVDCTVVDVSASGARVRVDRPQLIPARRVTLMTNVAGEEVFVTGHLRRAEPGTTFALMFDDPENARLHRLLAEAQRRDIVRGLRSAVERRRAPR